MGKSGKRSIMKSLKKTASRTLPIVEKGVSGVYDTMATGAKSVRKAMPFRSRSRALAGGRRTRRRTYKSRR